MIKKILDATNSSINIDANDIRDILDGDGMLAAFDASVSAKNTERMKDLVEQIGSKIASVATVKSMLFHLFFPEGLPLQMSELQLAIARRSITQAEENLRLYRNFYRAGTTTMSDQLEAQLLYQQSQDRYTDALAAHQNKLLAYRQSVGQ